MELKYIIVIASRDFCLSFNRTAYGIEIIYGTIVNDVYRAFNRTAYGIEIIVSSKTGIWSAILLIAPLMELKFTKIRHRLKRKLLLIAPLMELKYY